jgi:RHS repeat-associated protein
MPGRQLSTGYRFGFNGKEMDNEVSSTSNQYDYGFRIYNPRIGKFLSIDPLANSYSAWSPYTFAMNRPIEGIDLEGLEFYPTNTSMYYTVYKGEEVYTKDDVDYCIINLGVLTMHIPDVLYDENTGDFKFTHGGIVGPYGHDVKLKEPTFLATGRYYSSGPAWPWKLGGPGASPSTQGLHTTPDLSNPATPSSAAEFSDKNNDARGRLSTVLGAAQEGKKWYDFVNSTMIWNAMIEETQHRDNFYLTSVTVQNTVVNMQFVSPHSIPMGQVIQDITNFVMDGYLAYEPGKDINLTTYYREIVETSIGIMRENNISIRPETLELQQNIENDYQNNCTD